MVPLNFPEGTNPFWGGGCIHSDWLGDSHNVNPWQETVGHRYPPMDWVGHFHRPKILGALGDSIQVGSVAHCDTMGNKETWRSCCSNSR